MTAIASAGTPPDHLPPPVGAQGRAARLAEEAAAAENRADDAAALAKAEAALALDPKQEDAVELRERLRAYRDLDALRRRARAGEGAAMLTLTKAYREGHGVARDPKAAREWAWRAANAGDPGAMADLGLALAKGGNPEAAVEWFRKAADGGNVVAAFNLALSCREGRGVAADPAEALRRFRAVAESGRHSRAVAPAMMWLGVICHDGAGVAADRAESMRWLRAAAELGDAAAMTLVAEGYFRGDGAPPDPEAGARWLEAAAEAGDASVWNKLGLMCAAGDRGLPRDERRAAACFRRGAEAGLVPAMSNLAFACFEGKGVPRDPAEGRRWLQAAADRGDAFAARWLKENLG